MQIEITSAFIEELIDLIDHKNIPAIVEKLEDFHPADIAEIMDDLSFEEAIYVFELMDDDIVSDIIVELEEDVRERILRRLSSKQIASELIDDLETDDAADILAELPEKKKQEVISEIEDVEHAKDIVDLLRYDEDSAGGLMAKELVKVNENWTVLTCVKEMRKQAEDVDKVHSIYVVDDENKLLGTLSLKSLLTTPTKTPIRDIFIEDIHFVEVNEASEEVAIIMQKYDLFVIPVVDDLNHLVGRITIDDIVDVIVEEAEKDYQMASGISQDVESSDTVWQLFKARFPWLLIGLFGSLTSGNIIGFFHEFIQQYILLITFIPLIAAMGGNVGVQSSAIIVQGLANNTIRDGGMFKRVFKEIALSLSIGIVLSILISLFILWQGSDKIYAVIISSALTLVIVIAALIGTLVPLVLDKYDIDPAIATGPFITTTNDILGVFIYFSIAQMILT
ncbi:MAG: magnesium transporter [Flavobacteriales bacterium]|nr:magnesium transporter [Flavobacteriales bacterium]